jgi:hypothetical protein
MTMQLQPIRVVANFEPALLAALDEYRRSLPVIPSRAAVLRQAVRVFATARCGRYPGAAAEQAGLAQEINQALHVRDMPLAQALILEGAAVYGHGPLLAAVEAHARQEAVAAAEVVRREADETDPWADDREPYGLEDEGSEDER